MSLSTPTTSKSQNSSSVSRSPLPLIKRNISFALKKNLSIKRHPPLSFRTLNKPEMPPIGKQFLLWRTKRKKNRIMIGWLALKLKQIVCSVHMLSKDLTLKALTFDYRVPLNISERTTTFISLSILMLKLNIKYFLPLKKILIVISILKI